MQRDPQFLLDMLQSAQLAVCYSAGHSETDFLADVQLQDAVIRRILIVAEAARRVSETTRQATPQIPWADINGMRNRLVHEYDDVDLTIVWYAVQSSLPRLIAELEKTVYPEEN